MFVSFLFYLKDQKDEIVMSLSMVSFGCAVCFGDPNSLSSKALVTAVFVLFGVVVSVLAGIAWTGFVWTRRSKKMEGPVS